MINVNRAVVGGNLTKDPFLRKLGNGASVASFRLAVNERFRAQDGSEKEDTCFVEIETWGKQAELCTERLRKGAPALVEGRLRYDAWEDKKSSSRRSKLLLKADRVHFLDSRREQR